MGASRTCRYPTTPVTNIASIMASLLSGEMSTSTKCQYKRVFHLFTAFQQECSPRATAWPASPGIISSFVTYLYSKTLAPATILTYISALASMHKLAGLPDPTASFLVKKIILGVQKKGHSVDKRLPITSDILVKLLHPAPHLLIR